MKHTLCFAVTALALGLMTNAARAYAGVCSNYTIKGTYASTLRGQIFIPDGPTIVIDGIVRTTYDGKGDFTQLDAVADNGILTPGWRPGSGTYSVNPDCTGTATITIEGLPDLHLQFIVSESGNRIRSVVIDPGVATTAEGERVHSPRK